jgi:hypothetical protein
MKVSIAIGERWQSGRIGAEVRIDANWGILSTTMAGPRGKVPEGKEAI